MPAAADNDVWGTINHLADVAGGYFGARVRSTTTAAPSGQVVYTNAANPFPGTQGAFPQAEAKPAPGGVGLGFSLSGMSGWVIGAVLVVILLALARR